MERPQIAIIHPQLIEGGGSESRALWAAEALKNDYRVYLITMENVSFEQLNQFYGTNLTPGEVEIIKIPIPYLLKNRFDALKGYRLARFCKKKSFEFNLMISTYNVMDFGRRGIQFIADFSFDDRLRRKFDPTSSGIRRMLYQDSPFRRIYLFLGKILSGSLQDTWKRNLTIANSDWSGKTMKEVYGIETQTIYPPVVSKFPFIPWDKREDGFVCIGNLFPWKRLERVIEILGKVRKRGWNIHLHIFGRAYNSNYVRNLKRLCEKNCEWAFMEGTLFGNKKMEFIAQHKFGISGRENEPFGIAVAEMVRTGCIVWVPNGGGQVEIVDHPTLTCNSIEDAVHKIEKVLKNNAMQIELHKHLAKQSKKFSTEKFKTEIRKLVHEFLEERDTKKRDHVLFS